MKTKELIAELQKLDPSGELEVVADGVPIYFAECLPAYYDGVLQILIQDKSKPNYNIQGYKVSDQGQKILLRSMDLEAVLWDNADAPVDMSELRSSYSQKLWIERVDKIRTEVKQFENEKK